MPIIFLSYINRSGSTLLVNLLSKFTEICICPEADILYNLLLTEPCKPITIEQEKKWKSVLINDTKLKQWNINMLSVFELSWKGRNRFDLFQALLTNFQQNHFPISKIIIFKHNFLNQTFQKMEGLKVINKYDVKGITLTRLPQAIYASQKKNTVPGSKKLMCQNPLLFSRFYKKFSCQHQQVFSHQCMHSMAYESLIIDSVAELVSLLSFLNIPAQNVEINLKDTGKVFQFLSADHKLLHPNIEKPMLLGSLTQWGKILSDFDIYHLYFNFNDVIPLSEKPKFRMDFILYYSWFLMDFLQYCLKQFLRRLKFKIDILN